jgi:hypothetical protein
VVESALGVTHHHAAMQVLPDGEVEGDRSRLVWDTDVVPDHLAAPIADLMDQCAAAVQRTLAAQASEATVAS